MVGVETAGADAASLCCSPPDEDVSLLLPAKACSPLLLILFVAPILGLLLSTLMPLLTVSVTSLAECRSAAGSCSGEVLYWTLHTVDKGESLAAELAEGEHESCMELDKGELLSGDEGSEPVSGVSVEAVEGMAMECEVCTVEISDALLSSLLLRLR